MVCQNCQHQMIALKNPELELIGDIIDPFAITGEDTEVWYCKKCGHISYRN